VTVVSVTPLEQYVFALDAGPSPVRSVGIVAVSPA
jgi:hypothetical protein